VTIDELTSLKDVHHTRSDVYNNDDEPT